MKAKDHIRKEGKVWYLDVYINGVRIQRSLKEHERDKAIAKAQSEIDKLLAKTTEVIVNERKVTLDQAIDDYLLSKMDVKQSTRNFYGHMKTAVLSRLDRTMLACDMSAQVMNDLIRTLQREDMSVDTICHITSFLKSVYRHAHRRRFTQHHLLEEFSPPKQKAVVIKFFTKDEVTKLLDLLEGHNYGAVLISLHTGMRKMEILHMRFPWIDFEKKLITIPAEHAKSSTMRKVPISDDLLVFLRERYAESEVKAGYVLSPDKGQTPYENVRKAFYTGLKAIGRDHDCDFHTCRHTFATYYLEKHPGHYTELMQICGWNDVQTAMRYSHETEQYRIEKQQRVSALYN